MDVNPEIERNVAPVELAWFEPPGVIDVRGRFLPLRHRRELFWLPGKIMAQGWERGETSPSSLTGLLVDQGNTHSKVLGALVLSASCRLETVLCKLVKRCFQRMSVLMVGPFCRSATENRRLPEEVVTQRRGWLAQ